MKWTYGQIIPVHSWYGAMHLSLRTLNFLHCFLGSYIVCGEGSFGSLQLWEVINGIRLCTRFHGRKETHFCILTGNSLFSKRKNLLRCCLGTIGLEFEAFLCSVKMLLGLASMKQQLAFWDLVLLCFWLSYLVPPVLTRKILSLTYWCSLFALSNGRLLRTCSILLGWKCSIPTDWGWWICLKQLLRLIK